MDFFLIYLFFYFFIDKEGWDGDEHHFVQPAQAM